MKHKLKLIFLFFVIFLFVSNSSAQRRNYSINTVSGKLSVSSVEDGLECTIKLGVKVLTTYECDYSPDVLKNFKQNVSPFDQVIVFQNGMLGNACDGLDVFLVGVNKNKRYVISESIPYCGGPAPIVVAKSGKITVTLPGHRANRGNNYIRKEIWVFEKGILKQSK